jgi:hypothetical protein
MMSSYRHSLSSFRRNCSFLLQSLTLSWWYGSMVTAVFFRVVCSGFSYANLSVVMFTFSLMTCDRKSPPSILCSFRYRCFKLFFVDRRRVWCGGNSFSWIVTLNSELIKVLPRVDRASSSYSHFIRILRSNSFL